MSRKAPRRDAKGLQQLEGQRLLRPQQLSGIRELAGLTSPELARASGWPRSVIDRLQCSDCQSNQFVALVDCLQVCGFDLVLQKRES